MSKKIPFFIVLILIKTHFLCYAQSIDSNYIFNSPNELVSSKSEDLPIKQSAGANLLLTESGFGAGIFYDYRINKILCLQIDLPITYLRASDEFEELVPNSDSTAYVWGVKDKINRLYRMPLTAGIRYNFLSEALGEGFKPYIVSGAGVGFVFALPYKYTFFQSLNYTKLYIKPAFYIGLGADFSGKSKRISRVFFKYYYIPFGGDGIESIKNLPIKNCGGIFIGLDIGLGWN